MFFIFQKKIWDACSDAMITFNEDQLSDELAYIVENDLVLHAVNTELSKKESVTVINDAKVDKIILPESRVLLEGGKSITSKLLVRTVLSINKFFIFDKNNLFNSFLSDWS